MLRLMISIMLLAVFFPNSLTAKNEEEPNDKKSKLTLEFRRAETEAAKGLKEAAVRGSKQKIYLHPKAEVTLADVEEVTLSRTPTDVAAVSIRLTKKGAEKMRKLTENHIDKPLAIIVNGEVLVAPIIRETLSSNVMISGLKEDEADEIVKLFEDR